MNESIITIQQILDKFNNELSEKEKEALLNAIEALHEVKNNQVTRGGLYVPLSEVQAMLRNIQRQL